MTATSIRPVPPSRLIGVLLALTTGAAWAELYKCRQPDGSLSYQQAACAAQAEGERLQVDIRGPDGRESASSDVDYSVAAQAERLRTEREARERAHLQARREAEARARALKAAAKPDRNTDFDPAKCARHRGEVAKWRQKVKGAIAPATKRTTTTASSPITRRSSNAIASDEAPAASAATLTEG